MPQPPLDPPVADTAPNAETLTPYDEEHLVTYLRLLDAEADGADWTEVAVSSCASIPRASPPAPAAPGKAIWHARSGWPNTAIGTFCAAAPLVDVHISGGHPAVAYLLALTSGPGGRRCRPSHDPHARHCLSGSTWALRRTLDAEHSARFEKNPSVARVSRVAASRKSFTRTTPAESVKLQTDAFVATSIRHHVMPCVRLPHAAVAREAATRGRRTSFACSEPWGDQRCHRPPIGGLRPDMAT